ncbi:MAG: DNA (cytosine-5-)-methyltransferase [Puniceicoccaceae bacterium]
MSMRSVELFSGAGGLALGLEEAGFKNEGLFEMNKNACATLRHNRPSWNVFETDVRGVDFKDFAGVELVAGGPPCQPFSMGGKAKGSNDSRDMFPQAIRAVREIRPKAFIFENVRGLLRGAFSNYVEYLRLQMTYPNFPVSDNLEWCMNLRRLQRHHSSRRDLSDLEYNVSIQCVNAADYGVPQKRHRVFFVGLRKDLNVGWSFPETTHSFEKLLFDQFVGFGYWGKHKITPLMNTEYHLRHSTKIRSLGEQLLPCEKEAWSTVRDVLRKIPDPSSKNTLLNHRFQSGAKSYPGHTGSLLDEPAKALKAGDHGVPGGENMLRNDCGKVRYFTVREAAILQTFPMDFEFIGSWTESMRQLGNAVPVQLAKIVAHSVSIKLSQGNERERVLQSAR